MNTTRHKPKEKKFFGEATGIFLAHWLNGPSEKPWRVWREEFVQRFGFISGTSVSDAKARDRIAHLLRKLKQFVELADEISSDQYDSKGTRDWPLLKGLNDSINNDFAKYPAYPQIKINLVKDKLGRFKPFLQDRGAYYWGSSPVSDALIQEMVAVRYIQDAERQRWLNQVRECRVCGRWFFARRRGSNNCSPKCRKKEYQSSERYREWRRDHYLNYEKLERIRKQTRLELRRDK
jgi:hypothetical protein